MFGLFKKKKPENQFVAMLAFDDSTYARVVAELFETMDPATRAHVLVAYENLVPLLSAMWSAGKSRGEEVAVEQFIPLVAERLDAAHGDEIGSRRWAWFLFASLLGRLEKLARNNPAITGTGAKIWCTIAEEAPRLKGLLPRNVVWKPEEKEWFDLSMSDEKLVEWTINHAIPPVFAKLDSVESFARSRGLFYRPSKSRIGTIP
ncbi:hypothetical protein [Nitratireductor luteus]|uniref:hypothetical protein n=1 Tax=Nitratireductor luteus TaxID=2976980 RepID=UPI00223EF105|nr:hypothetical protein [Nitratireductor luteus]